MPISQGDPVAMVSLPVPHDEKDNRVQIGTRQMGFSEVYLSGWSVQQE